MDVLSVITYAKVWNKDNKEKRRAMKARELSTKGNDIIHKEKHS